MGGFGAAVVVNGAKVVSSMGVVIVSLDSVVGCTEIKRLKFTFCIHVYRSQGFF